MRENLRENNHIYDFKINNLSVGFKNRHRMFITISLVTLLICITTTLVVRAYNHHASFSPPAPESAKMLSAAQPLSTPSGSKVVPQSERIEAELITVTPNGFEPKEIVRPAGKFLIAIENRSGLKGLSMAIDSPSGNRVLNGTFPKEKLSLKQLADYQPGKYTLTEENHPEWICYITITEK
jgi:hypothetical protein